METNHAYPFERYPDKSKWAAFATNFDGSVPQLASLGVRVINAPLDSEISAYPKHSLAEALEVMT